MIVQMIQPDWEKTSMMTVTYLHFLLGAEIMAMERLF